MADNWPYSYVLETQRPSPILLIVEQGGIDLKIIDSQGSVSNSSQSRMGPEFILVEPEDEGDLILVPVYGNSASGVFRIHTLPLDTPQLTKTAKRFSRAGLKGGLFSQQSLLSACSEYDSLIDDVSTAQWRHIASTLLVGCNLRAGVKSSKQQLLTLQKSSLDDSENYYSIFPYQLDWLLARHYFSLQDYESAEDQFSKALEKAQTSSVQAPHLRDAINQDIAEIYSQYGDNGMMLSWKMGKGKTQELLLSQSVQRIKTAISIAEPIGNSQILGNAYNNLAGVLYVQGKSEESIEYMELAERYLGSAGDAHNQRIVLGNMGDYYRRWGQLRAAQNAYHKATTLYSPVGNVGSLYSKLASLNLLFLDLDLAIQNAQKAIEYYKAAGQEQREYELISKLATILRDGGDFVAAQEKRQEALAYFVENGWIVNALTTQSELSHDERLLGNITQAYQLSLDVIKQLENSNFEVGVDQIPIYTNHAQLLFELGRTNDAIQQLQDVLIEVEINGAEPADEILLLATLLGLYQELGQTESAIVMADNAFELIESQRVEFDTVRLGPRWSARTNSIYASHIEHLLQQRDQRPEYIERAFVVAERAQAVSLRRRRQEMMLNNIDGNQVARSEWVDIVSQLEQSQRNISSEDDRIAFERRFNEARERYFAAHGLAEQLHAPEILSSKQIRALIPEDSMVLQYMAGSEKIWRFNLSKNYFSVTEIGDLEQVSSLVESTLQDLKNPNMDNRVNLRRLSEVLLKDVSADLGVNKILISPTSKLDSMPFASLYNEERYLIDTAVLTMVPSLSEYFNPAEFAAPDPDRLEIAVLADPAFEQLSVDDSYSGDSDQFRSWSGARKRLPYTAKEAKDIARYFEEDDRLILTGADATQANFFSSPVRNAKIIHIATHGYFNEELPELVGLALAKVDDQDDGFVSLAEIAAQDFSAELVVISACDTGRGFDVPGEGALSLSRSFLAQGVGSVVSTLWPVSDIATSIFMKEFYRSIREEMLGPAESLQQAQQTLKRDPRYRDAFYWGAYVLTSATQYNPGSE
jgi:CHAT domain-containing protein